MTHYALLAQAKRRERQLQDMAKPLQRKCLYCGAEIGNPCTYKDGREILTVAAIHGIRISSPQTYNYRHRRRRDRAVVKGE